MADLGPTKSTIQLPVLKPRRKLWNKGRLIGQKRSLVAKQDWAIRAFLELAGNLRDSALFNLAIDRIDAKQGQVSARINLAALLPAEKFQQPIHTAFEISFQKRRNGRAKPVIIAPLGAPQPDQDIIYLVADATRWSAKLLDGRSCTIRQIEDREGLRSGSVSRMLPLAWLAPDISAAILDGRQPAHLTAKILRDIPNLPLDWQDQRKILGFPHQ